MNKIRVVNKILKYGKKINVKKINKLKEDNLIIDIKIIGSVFNKIFFEFVRIYFIMF